MYYTVIIVYNYLRFLDVTVLNISSSSNAVNCSLQHDGSMLSCCLESSVLQRTLQADLYIDACNYLITATVENINISLPMLTYEFGTICCISFPIYNFADD